MYECVCICECVCVCEPGQRPFDWRQWQSAVVATLMSVQINIYMPMYVRVCVCIVCLFVCKSKSNSCHLLHCRCRCVFVCVGDKCWRKFTFILSAGEICYFQHLIRGDHDDDDAVYYYVYFTLLLFWLRLPLAASLLFTKFAHAKGFN